MDILTRYELVKVKMLASYLYYHIYSFVTIIVLKRFYLIKGFQLIINLQVLLS